MKCKIYFIQCLETGEKYIGSTKQRLLSDRIAHHKSKRNCSSIQILDRCNYVYDILEEVEECDRYTREQYYIETTDNCVNVNRAYTELKGKDYHKQYHLDNKDKFKEINKQYQKQYYLDNKDKLKEKYTCDCGSVFQVYTKSRHEKSIKHQNYLKNNCCKAI